MTSSDLSRRGVLRSGLSGAALLSLGGVTGSLLTACSTDEPSNQGAPGAGTPKRGGTLRLALGGASQSDTLDSMKMTTVWDVAIAYNLYSRLLERVLGGTDDAPTLEVGPGLAEEITYETPTAMVVRLREGVEFHHGKTVSAEDVIFSLRRQVDPKDPKSGARDFGNIDFESTKILDDRTIRLVLKTPDTFLRVRLPSTANVIVPTDFDPTKPVGTGPFKFESFAPGRSVKFSRFENYFLNDGPYLDALEIQAFSDASAQVNALVSGAADALGNVPPAQIKVLENNTDFQVHRSKGGGSGGFAMRTRTSPLTDPRVREAMRHLIDREAVVSQCYNGEAVVGNDLFNPTDPAYASDLPVREYDPERAKSLLADAGVSPVELSLAVGNLVPNLEVVFAESAKAGGVAVKVLNVDDSTFYSDHYGIDPLFSTLWYARPIAEMVNLTQLRDSTFAEIQPGDEQKALYQKAASSLDEAEQNNLLGEMQRIQYDSGGYLLPVHPNQVDAASTKVKGLGKDGSGRPFGSYNFLETWLA